MKCVPLADRDGKTVAHAMVDDEDYPAIMAYRWYLTKAGYAKRNKHREGRWKSILMHRFILSFPAGHIDHRDRNPLNNQRVNLRLATRFQNAQNRNVNSSNLSGFRGVGWHRKSGKWQAKCNLNKRSHYLGLFETPEEADEVVKLFREENMPYSEEVSA